MNTTEIPQRWVRGIPRPAGFVDGPDEALWHAHREAGRPADIAAFRLGFEGGMHAAARSAAVPVDLVDELKKAHRIIYLQRMQMSTQARALYARNAHHAGLIGDDETRETERAALLARAGVSL